MNTLTRLVAALFVSALVVTVPARSAPGAEAAKRFVCPPCSAPCDTLVFDAPGTCPQCGMALVAQESLPKASARKKVAILIFNGVEIIDYTGPWEMFGAANFEVFTVASDRNPTTTAMGMTVVPNYTFADAPPADVVLVPGGTVKGARSSEATLAWLRGASAAAGHTLSVCNGAFILASAGLLDGLRATTTASNIDRMRKEFPKVTVVDNARVVDNGRIVTAGGLTAGIDGALHLIAGIAGHGTAQQVALSEEYDWHPEGGFVRAALADREIPNVNLDAMGDFHVVTTQGDSRHWNLVIRGSSKLSAADLTSRIAGELESSGAWRKANAAVRSAATSGAWSFVGRDGKPWNAGLTIAQEPGDHQYSATLRLARKS